MKIDAAVTGTISDRHEADLAALSNPPQCDN
jgi:hypothetical protein